MANQKQLENVESLKYLGSILSKYGRCTFEINVGLLWLKLHSTRRGLFLPLHMHTSTLDLELKKKLVKCYIWSIALYGVET